MKREFTINIILLIIINLLIKPTYIFGIEARIQNLVGIEAYGLYFAYFNFVFLFQFINDPGIQNWNAQNVPKNRDNVSSLLPSLFKVKAILSIIFICVVLISSLIIGYTDQKLILLLCFNMVLSTLFMFFRGTIAGLGYYKTDSLLSVLDKTLMILILGYLAWISAYQKDFNILGFVYGQAIAYLISCIVAGTFLIRKISLNYEKLTLVYFTQVIKSSAPYVLILLFMTAYNKLDGVMLGSFIDDHNYQAGLYATAYRFYDAANMIGYMFAALLLPMFAANVAQRSNLKILMEVGLKYVVISAVIIILSCFYYGDIIMKIMFDDYTSEFFLVLRILITSYLMVAIAYIFGTMLVACGKVNTLNYIFGIGLLVNIVLNIFLIPRYQAIGAALSTLITQSFVMIGQVLLVRMELKMGIQMKEIFRLLLFTCLSILVFLGFKSTSAGHWYLILGISILICLLLSFILKILDKDEIIYIFRKDR